ncbi:hypothetical protein CHCC14809_0335 [Bacillus licheniformis]|nr:hypothetical protein CHCC15087_4317 [Bacillus licheniformis]TWM82597.1 hypothetical protein CHCC14809_0335 [Bacillus licheniformis]TWM96609.1 hypothetical protein CHCC14596_3247 [Bacillus licheniformis]TWO10861.1 hypothetical protein CHCC14431_1501 [Bacillus licheniformis]
MFFTDDKVRDGTDKTDPENDQNPHPLWAIRFLLFYATDQCGHC